MQLIWNPEYWIYENWTQDKAVVHIDECPDCNYGKGKHVVKSSGNGRWLGPFSSREIASNVAKQLERRDDHICLRCNAWPKD